MLIGGPTGSGKSTTLAALVEEINRRDHRHIVTIEDPIEYEHVHHGCIVEQVEIGMDAPDFPTALRAALRQAPDVIVVGEMRDPETMRIALSAAETGHLVLSTVHTTDVASTISRIADSFPPERQNTIRQELAMALAAVLTQTLLPKVGGGLVPAAELLMVGYGARQHIRRNALQHLHQEITITRKAAPSPSRNRWRVWCAKEWSKLARRTGAPCTPRNSNNWWQTTVARPEGRASNLLGRHAAWKMLASAVDFVRSLARCREGQMKFVRRTLAVCLAVLFMAPMASAQSHVIGKTALDKAVQQRVARDQADRDAI